MSGTVFPFPVQPMTASRQLRLAVVSALERAQLLIGSSPVSVDSPGDWPYPHEKLPAVCVRAPNDSKQSLTKGNTQYTTIVEVDVRAAVGATTGEAAQDALEALWFQIERAILTDFYVLELVQNVSGIETSREFKADGRIHFAGAISRFRFETFETFDVSQPAGTLAAPSVASPIAPLTEVTVDIARAGADPPYSKQPDDLGLTITLPQED